MVAGGVALWDFERTLVEGPGASSWTGCLYEVVSEYAPEVGVTLESVRAFRGAFPWHAEGGSHPELCDPVAWWTHVGTLIRNAYIDLGVSPGVSEELEHEVRRRYRNPSSYRVLPDAYPALEERDGQGGTT